MAKPRPFPPESTGQTLVSHLIEMRKRLIRILIGILVIFLILMPFARDLYTLLALPLVDLLPEGASMIATNVTSPFIAPFKFTLVLAIFLAAPFILFQLWSFVAPGLYQREKRMALPLLVASAVLFYAGMAFAYLVVFPLVFGFFIGIAPEGVVIMTDISEYLGFVLKMFFAFGLAFEIPIVTIILVWTGVTTPDALVAKRAYVIVGAFVLGMLLTPPDAISQLLLAIPMWLLFECGVVFSRLFVKKREDVSSDDSEAAASSDDDTDQRRD